MDCGMSTVRGYRVNGVLATMKSVNMSCSTKEAVHLHIHAVKASGCDRLGRY
jgi:hypothetical protein